MSWFVERLHAMVTSSRKCRRNSISNMSDKVLINFSSLQLFWYYLLSGVWIERNACLYPTLNATTSQGYGLTEMSPVSHLATWKDTLPGSCGPSVSNTRWKVCFAYERNLHLGTILLTWIVSAWSNRTIVYCLSFFNLYLL